MKELMFSPSQISELITAIKGRGEIPLKFVYIGDIGASRWDEISKERLKDPRSISSIERKLLKSKVSSFLGSFKKLERLNVIDIGPGNGDPVIPLLQTLKVFNIHFRYVPIDISKEILDLAVKNVKKLFPGLETEPIVLDFETGNFASQTYRLRQGGFQNLMLFLGSTLGNQSDRSRILTNFRDSMTSDDFLIIGVELVNLYKIDKILKHYQGKATENFLFTVAEFLGIKRSDGRFEIRFNEATHQIEAYFRFMKDRKIIFAGEEIIFEPDDQLLLGRSHKFTEWKLVQVLSDVGFRIELMTTSSEKGYTLIMCQPQRFNY